MSSIPYNYHKYIDDVTKMRQRGAISAGEQVQSPSSAGSRGLAKTTQFTNDRTQMQMGNTTMSESIIEIRNILNRIDGVNVPVQEDLDYRSEDILNKAGFDPADIDTYMKVFNDHGDTSDIDQMNMKEKVGLADVMSMVLASHGIQNESYEPFPEEDEMTFEDDDAFYEAFGELGFPEDETELFDAEYRGRKVPLNKPMRGDVKKLSLIHI